MRGVSVVKFEGWYSDDCHFTVTVDFVKKILVHIAIKLECYGYDYYKISADCYPPVPEDNEALTELLNKVLDFASLLISSSKEVKITRCSKKLDRCL